jgi:hypothetical protein
VAPGYNQQPASNNRPSTIYVYPFAASAADVTLNQGFIQKTYRQLSDSNQDQGQLDVAHQTAGALADSMVQQLQNLGFTASLLGEPRSQVRTFLSSMDNFSISTKVTGSGEW